MTKDETLKLALDFVASISPAFICEATHHKKNERHADNEPCPHVKKQKQTYEAIKEALAQPEQEPVAWPCRIDSADFSENTITLAMQREDYIVSVGTHWLSKTPPQRKPLTDEQIDNIAKNYALNNPTTPLHFARAIEAAHGIKENT